MACVCFQVPALRPEIHNRFYNYEDQHNCDVLRWPNTVFARTLLLTRFSARTRMARNKHAVDTAIILFAQCPHDLCYIYS